MQIELRQAQQQSPLSAELPELLDRLFRHRGIKTMAEVQTQAKNLLHYQGLKGIEEAAELLGQAIMQGRNICIIGDFDADGATSTAVCMLAFARFGHANIQYLVPNRFDFGYGLSPEIVDVAAQQGAQLILTVDNGISCIAGVQRAKELGLEVVITDHHLPGEQAPAADAIVNPNQHGCTFASKSLAGVGVAFYVMLAIKNYLTQQEWFTRQSLRSPNLAELLDIVAIGTVADVVPLDTNNRILVHQGLQRIRSGITRPGINALLEVANRAKQRLSASDLGFVIGPRLNAAGRLDDMALGIECLLAEDSYQARKMAANLDQLNLERRDIESSMQAEAMQSLASLQLRPEDAPNSLVIYKDDFHQGVIGILAGRLKDKFYRPTIVFAEQDDNNIKGSARSIAGVHIRDVLDRINTQHPKLISKFGGHAMAAGLSMPKESLKSFEIAFEKECEHLLKSLPKQQVILSDGQLSPAQISLDNAQMLKLSVPWGQTFEEPIFDGEFDLRAQRLVGEKHLKMVVSTGNTEFDAIAFNIDPQIWPNSSVNKVHLAYKLDVNEFRGNVSVQLLVSDLSALK